ncbi:MAG: hypothetical protein IJE10_02340 [Clostridia bacterium]|nr:hypothetical protein [Clostridia bacterium]
MKVLERILAVVSILAIIAVIITLVFQWKKDGEIWRTIKTMLPQKKIVDLEE